MPRVYALVDCNNFYVSCERLFRPDLRGLPVVVLSNNDGCVVSRSNEAKVLGIGMGEPYFKMRDLIALHGVEVFSSNYALYGNISARVVSVLRELAPRIEVYSIDESFVDLTGVHRPLAAYGRFIKAEVERLTGMPVGVGVATTKTLTKLANWAAKKRSQSGVVVATRPEQQQALLKAAPVGEVWGIGRQMQKHLAAMNITTAWDLAQQDAKSMRKLFSVVVEKTIRELRGEQCYGLDEGPEPKQMIACSRSFSERVTELEPLREAVATYASRAAEKLRQQGYACQMMQVYIRTGVFNPDERRYARTANVPLPYPTNDSRDLTQAALAGLQALYLPGYRYQKAGVVLMHFVNPAHLQGDLFSPESRPRSAELMNTMDKINSQMGRGTVRLARIPANGSWAMKQQLKSLGYTSSWRELPVAR